MLKFKKDLKRFIHEHHLANHTSGKKNQIIEQIEKMQLEKREKGIDREWGDSFFEEIVEEKLQQERENQQIVIDDDEPEIQSD
jgi:ABC-type phosphate transport system auxiliary subunit